MNEIELSKQDKTKVPKENLRNGELQQTGNSNQLTNSGFRFKRKSTKYESTRVDRNSKGFFDLLISNKKVIMLNE